MTSARIPRNDRKSRSRTGLQEDEAQRPVASQTGGVPAQVIKDLAHRGRFPERVGVELSPLPRKRRVVVEVGMERMEMGECRESVPLRHERSLFPNRLSPPRNLSYSSVLPLNWFWARQPRKAPGRCLLG